jgi:hypothetical protein
MKKLKKFLGGKILIKNFPWNKSMVGLDYSLPLGPREGKESVRLFEAKWSSGQSWFCR